MESTSDVYLTLFSIKEDGSAAKIFPNRFFTENKLHGHNTRRIPNEQERKAASYRALEREDIEPPYSEMILAVATRERVRFPVDEAMSYDSDFMEINRWLMDIPHEERVQAYTDYLVMP